MHLFNVDRSKFHNKIFYNHKTHVTRPLVAPTVSVVKLIVRQFAPALLVTLVVHQPVIQNALLVLIVC